MLKHYAKKAFSQFIKIFHSHKITPENSRLIIATRLFDDFDKTALALLFKKAKKIYLKQDKLILKEGDLGDTLYVILHGTVRIFTKHLDEKIILATLEKGAYFGEQAILGQTNNTRSANVETITEVILAEINAKYVVPHWAATRKVLEKLKKIGYTQIQNTLSKIINNYQNTLAHLKNIEGAFVKDIEPRKIIFSIGDQPDYVYLVLQGSVEILIQNKDSKKIVSNMIHRGQVFGELSIINNKKRAGTAISQNNLKVLCIDGNLFKKAIDNLPDLKKLFQIQAKTYEVSSYGITEQYIGKVHGISTLTNIYKLDDGRTVIATQMVENRLFTMKIPSQPSTTIYTYKNRTSEIKLGVTNNQIVDLEIQGDWDELPIVCGMIIKNEPVEAQSLEQFKKSGTLIQPPRDNIKQPKIICYCMMVTQDVIQKKINSGCDSLDQISKETGACTVCKGCKFQILEMLGKASWLQGTLTPLTKHNDTIRSFIVKTTDTPLNPFIPGQYVIIQVKINNDWLERAYTISDKLDAQSLRITVKREPKGLFSNWVFDTAPTTIAINIAEPQGEFTLNSETHAPVICFAGGVGITPFIAFAKHFEHKRPIHILYCALTEADFIFADEFNAVTETKPSITVEYRPTNQKGLLSKEEIINALEKFPNADIYICGPEGLEKLISNTLKEINYDKNKIHVEKFVYAFSNSNQAPPLS